MQPSKHHDEYEDIMANIMNGQRVPTPTPTPPATPPQRQYPTQSTQPKGLSPQQSYSHMSQQSQNAPQKPLQAPQPVNQSQTYDEPFLEPQRSGGRFDAAVAFLVVGIIVTLGAIGFFYRQPLLALLAPPSPFTAEMRETLPFPLYYPTDLPAGYKIETKSFNTPETGILVYEISDEEDHTMFVSLQATNDAIDINKVFEGGPEPRLLEVPLGNAWIGTNTEGTVAAHLVGEKTWIIVTFEAGMLDDTQMNDLLASFRQG